MVWKRAGGALVLAVVLACSASPTALARDPVPAASAPASSVVSEHVSFGAAGQGILWTPALRGDRARVAVVLAHPTLSSLGHPLCPALAARGFLALCVDPAPPRTAFPALGYEAHAPALRAAIMHARAEPGVRSVALAGHGDGAALAAFYQNVARNGPRACQGAEKIAPCEGGRLGRLPAADALIMIDPELGKAFATLASLDPAVGFEGAPTQRYPDLDMYDPRNGFDPGRNAANYPPGFRKAFHEAQSARNARLIEEARKKASAVTARDRDAFIDDMPLFVAGARGTRLWQVDAALLSRTKRAHKLLTANGEASRPLVSVALPVGNPREASSLRAASFFSARGFLARHAIYTTPAYDVTADDIVGVVWSSSPTSSIANVAGIAEPLLILAMTAHHALRPAEMILDAAASADKELAGVDGATHFMQPCQACGDPARFGDTQKRAFDHIEGWLAQRF